jgi:hypothetical protein
MNWMTIDNTWLQTVVTIMVRPMTGTLLFHSKHWAMIYMPVALLAGLQNCNKSNAIKWFLRNV